MYMNKGEVCTDHQAWYKNTRKCNILYTQIANNTRQYLGKIYTKKVNRNTILEEYMRLLTTFHSFSCLEWKVEKQEVRTALTMSPFRMEYFIWDLTVRRRCWSDICLALSSTQCSSMFSWSPYDNWMFSFIVS